jgi:hypothetical protein
MKDATTICAELTLVGERFDIQHVTDEMGISPSKSKKKGEILKSGNVSKDTFWRLDTGYMESLDSEAVLDKLIGQVRDKASKMTRLSLNCGADWRVGIVIKIENGKAPGTHLSRETIKFIHAINADVDFDIYVLSECKKTERI